MKIEQVVMDWEYMVPIVTVDKIPDDLVFKEHKDCYFAESDGYVEFYYYRQPGHGYGGNTFKIKMVDGTFKSLLGPWSSRPSVMNMMGFTPSMTCMYDDIRYRCYGCITVEKLKGYLDEHPELGLMIVTDEESNDPKKWVESKYSFVCVDSTTRWKRV